MMKETKRGEKHVQLVIQLISLERRQKTVDGTEKGCVNRICNAERERDTKMKGWLQSSSSFAPMLASRT